MRSFSGALCLCVVFAFAFVQLASAQMSIAGPTAKVMVIMMPEAKKELKLTKDQDKQITTILGEASKATPTMGMDPMSMMTDLDTKAMAVLSADQQVRATQLWIQYDGPTVLQDKAIAEALKMTDDQKEKVKDIWSGYQQQYMEKARSPSGFKSLKNIRKTLNETTLAVLTPDQLAAYTDMQGKLIKFRAKREI